MGGSHTCVPAPLRWRPYLGQQLGQDEAHQRVLQQRARPAQVVGAVPRDVRQAPGTGTRPSPHGGGGLPPPGGSPCWIGRDVIKAGGGNSPLADDVQRLAQLQVSPRLEVKDCGDRREPSSPWGPSSSSLHPPLWVPPQKKGPPPMGPPLPGFSPTTSITRAWLSSPTGWKETGARVLGGGGGQGVLGAKKGGFGSAPPPAHRLGVGAVGELQRLEVEALVQRRLLGQQRLQLQPYLAPPRPQCRVLGDLGGGTGTSVLRPPPPPAGSGAPGAPPTPGSYRLQRVLGVGGLGGERG